MKQLDPYLARFGKDRFHFILFEQLMQRPVETIVKLERFLGVAEMNITTPPVAANVTLDYFVRASVLEHLGTFSLGKDFRNLLPGFVKSAAFKILSRTKWASRVREKVPGTTMKPTTRKELLFCFKEDTRRLERFLGQDLSAWKV